MAKNKPPKEESIVKGEKFTHGEDEYEILVPSVTVPGHGKLTALELATHEAAQKKLVESNSGVIKKLS